MRESIGGCAMAAWGCVLLLLPKIKPNRSILKYVRFETASELVIYTGAYNKMTRTIYYMIHY